MDACPVYNLWTIPKLIHSTPGIVTEDPAIGKLATEKPVA